MTHRSKNILINMFLLIFSIGASLAIAEVYTRNLIPVNYYTLDVWEGANEELENGTRKADLQLGFLPGPSWVGKDGIMGCQNGKEYLEGEKLKDGFNVLILGDSLMVTGYLEQAFKSILKNSEYNIYNAGIGSYNTVQESEYLRHYITVPFDLLVLGFCLNDFLPSGFVVDYKDKKKFAENLVEPIGYVNPYLFRYSALYRSIMVKWNGLLNQDNSWSKSTVVKNKENVKKALKGILNYCRKKNAEFIVAIYPHLEVYPKGGFNDEAHSAILEILQELGINYVDLHGICSGITCDDLKQHPRDVVHLNRKGHYMAGEAIIGKFPAEFKLTN